MSDITITINNQPHQVSNGSSLLDIVTLLAISTTGSVFAIGPNVIPRSEWATTLLCD
ncbi:sulfur carrier protein ThiS [Vibrio aestuarianus]|nr:thiamine biosynthesis protein ThiS [Vibrio aestuarianus]MDE1215022.1 thiamine biosynthesis protein ThiS [Vibrio aestuarianus]MDE1218266.1 thiamine biosynthesis protein ThiS [Vibrio aestuarianus]MDE1262113.1 thiamine biosynthesis protein ThiS [Vibrio aestuarianus]MDE1269183.1 thiamine biosynthesis protein ThiS [Vibrio aestuarianus]MDE1276400.1 thiamine biosynthesis protein ThiS [Vibrio aestuarianus]